MQGLVRVVIIEDQPRIAHDIARLMERQQGFVTVAIGKNVEEALLLIPATQPDLLLMDIELGDGTAFDILEKLAPLTFKVIFLTAFSEFAIKAIKFGAMDYLLKPLLEHDLALALGKVAHSIPVVAEQFRIARQAKQQLTDGKEQSFIALRSSPYLKVAAIADIMYLEASDKTVFHMQDGTKLAVSKTLGEYESILPQLRFLRPHRSFLVNYRYVDRYYHEGGYLVLKNGIEIPVSARRKEYVVSYLTSIH